MPIYIENDEDPGFREGQLIRWNGQRWLIETIKPNAQGIWAYLVGV